MPPSSSQWLHLHLRNARDEFSQPNSESGAAAAVEYRSMFAPSKITQLRISDLKPRSGNARTHSQKQIRKIGDSIRQFGFVNPIIVDERRCIIAGHGRLEAARQLGLETVPTIELDHLSPAEVRALVLADNKLATLAGWDRELLSIEIAELVLIAPDLDLTVTGFETEELENLQDFAPNLDDEFSVSTIAAPGFETAISEVGDLWHIGKHRLLCGDALDVRSYRKLLGAERVDLVITDPPYNVPIAGHVSGLGATLHREFAMGSGELSREQFRRFLGDACAHMARFSRSGSLHFIFMDWRSIGDLIVVGEQIYDDLLNVIVWVKNNGGMGSLYRSRHEFVALFKKGKRSHINNVELGSNGRYRTNVWEYPGISSFGSARASELKLHPTVKNTKMIIDAIKDVTESGALVLDAFAGSGTTLIAAEKCRRTARLIELDPIYCDVIVRRAGAIGLEVVLDSTGESFAKVEKRRISAQLAMGQTISEEAP